MATTDTGGSVSMDNVLLGKPAIQWGPPLTGWERVKHWLCWMVHEGWIFALYVLYRALLGAGIGVLVYRAFRGGV